MTRVMAVGCGQMCQEAHTYDTRSGCVHVQGSLPLGGDAAQWPADERAGETSPPADTHGENWGVPAPLMAGTFALYETPDGGLMLVTETPEAGVVHRGVPGAMVKMARKMAEGGGGPMGAALRKMMGG